MLAWPSGREDYLNLTALGLILGQYGERAGVISQRHSYILNLPYDFSSMEKSQIQGEELKII